MEEDEEEIIEEIFVDTEPLASEESPATPRLLVDPILKEDNLNSIPENSEVLSAQLLDIHKIEHFDNCNEEKGEIVPISTIDLDRLHKVNHTAV